MKPWWCCKDPEQEEYLNNRGPRIEPWGVPNIIVLVEKMFQTDAVWKFKYSLPGPITFAIQHQTNEGQQEKVADVTLTSNNNLSEINTCVFKLKRTLFLQSIKNKQKTLHKMPKPLSDILHSWTASTYIHTWNNPWGARNPDRLMYK